MDTKAKFIGTLTLAVLGLCACLRSSPMRIAETSNDQNMTTQITGNAESETPPQTSVPNLPPIVPTPVEPPPSVTLLVNGVDETLRVPYEAQVALTWSSNRVSECTLLNQGNAVIASGVQNSSGFIIVATIQPTIYRISCFSQASPVSDSITIVSDPPVNHIAFLTSTRHQGNLGGLSNGDMLCKQRAVAAGLRPEREWKALLSDEDTDVRDRILFFGKVYNNKGGMPALRELLQEAAGFWNTAWGASILYDEEGIAVTTGFSVWSGTSDSGVRSDRDCNAWRTRDSEITATVGQSNLGTIDERLSSGTSDCSESRRLYCVSQ